MRSANHRAPYARFVGMELDTIDVGRVRLRLPARADTTNRGGSLHGGVTASLLDVAGMLAARSVAGGGADTVASTIDLAIHYLAPAVREAVVIDGVVTRGAADRVRRGRRHERRGHADRAERRRGARGRAARGEPPPSAPPCPLDGTTRLVPRRSGSAFTARLGVLNATLATGHAVLVLPARDDLTGADGSVHEGALAALVDCAGGAASWSIDGFDPTGRAATIGMHLCYDRTPARKDIVVDARISWRAAGIFLNTVTLDGPHERPSGGERLGDLPDRAAGEMTPAATDAEAGGARCVRCRRPGALCLCRDLVPCATRTHVVILQHPREHTMRLGTARLTHLGLAGSELHVGVRFDDHPRLAALAASDGVALLYPGATPVDRTHARLRTLVVVDGTWSTARKIVARNPLLRALRACPCSRTRRAPTAFAASPRPSASRRSRPSSRRWSRSKAIPTDSIRSAPRSRGSSRRSSRARRPRPCPIATSASGGAGGSSPVETLLATRFDDVVLAQAEGSPHHDGGPHELVQLVALRPATGARFET